MSDQSFDIAIVGAGIVGLAHALAAARLGLRVVVLDRDARANGASIRNFGLITVTGQEQGLVWQRARRSRDIWAELSEPAGIGIEHHGLAMVAQRPEALAVLQSFMATDMALGCELLTAAESRRRLGPVQPSQLEGVLFSTSDLRVESRTAIPALAGWLAEAHGVTFLRGMAVQDIESGRLYANLRWIRADAIVVCPGDDLSTLFPDILARAGVTRCKLQMLRLAAPGYRLPHAVMSDLGLIRYRGYSERPGSAALEARLKADQPDHLANGIHLIVTQSADGSLVVGDSHHYDATPHPFAPDAVDRLILDEFAAVFGAVPPVIERWTGTYASAAGHSLVETPMEGVRLVVVTSGTGASTAFALAEEVIGEIVNQKLGAVA